MLLPFWNFIFPIVFDVSTKLPSLASSHVHAQSRAAALFSALAEIQISVIRLGELFQDKKSGKADRSIEGSFEDGLELLALDISNRRHVEEICVPGQF